MTMELLYDLISDLRKKVEEIKYSQTYEEMLKRVDENQKINKQIQDEILLCTVKCSKCERLTCINDTYGENKCPFCGGSFIIEENKKIVGKWKFLSEYYMIIQEKFPELEIEKIIEICNKFDHFMKEHYELIPIEWIRDFPRWKKKLDNLIKKEYYFAILVSLRVIAEKEEYCPSCEFSKICEDCEFKKIFGKCVDGDSEISHNFNKIKELEKIVKNQIFRGD